jgi:hypothetical protein|tara:strand:+ start:437 stop:748 length:312 start_codon:yes stop_codon:yes gene_type:complete
MATLSNKIKQYLNSEVDFTSDVILQDDGNGAYIKEWNLDIAQPTDAQLSAVESDADKMERNLNVDQERINAYGNIKDQLDEIYHNIDAWRTRIAKIKTDNPKE